MASLLSPQVLSGPILGMLYAIVYFLQPSESVIKLKYRSYHTCSATGAGLTLKSVLAIRIFTMYFVDEYTSVNVVEG